MSENLPAILDAFEPTLVLYDAGADAHEVDGLGHLELSDAGMLARDTAVLRECASRQRFPWPRSSAAAMIGIGAARRGAHATIFHAARAVWRPAPSGAASSSNVVCSLRRVDGVASLHPLLPLSSAEMRRRLAPAGRHRRDRRVARRVNVARVRLSGSGSD